MIKPGQLHILTLSILLFQYNFLEDKALERMSKAEFQNNLRVARPALQSESSSIKRHIFKIY